MKLVHDLHDDLEDTIPEEGGADSRWLFREMTVRTLSLVAVRPGERILDMASGMGQDTRTLAAAGAGRRAVGLEPSIPMMGWAAGQPGAREACWVRGLAEELPFAAESFDAVMCKGAMDHFMDPALTMREAARVLRPRGRMVLAIANFDSLSCRVGRFHHRLKGGRRAGGDQDHGVRPYFEPPADHLTRFGYRSIRALVRPPMLTDHVEGISLLWGFPPWGRALSIVPDFAADAMIGALGRFARHLPASADVIVVRAVKQG